MKNIVRVYHLRVGFLRAKTEKRLENKKGVLWITLMLVFVQIIQLNIQMVRASRQKNVQFKYFEFYQSTFSHKVHLYN